MKDATLAQGEQKERKHIHRSHPEGSQSLVGEVSCNSLNIQEYIKRFLNNNIYQKAFILVVVLFPNDKTYV